MKKIKFNPIAKALRGIRPHVVKPQKGKGSYSRKDKEDLKYQLLFEHGGRYVVEE